MIGINHEPERDHCPYCDRNAEVLTAKFGFATVSVLLACPNCSMVVSGNVPGKKTSRLRKSFLDWAAALHLRASRTDICLDKATAAFNGRDILEGSGRPTS